MSQRIVLGMGTGRCGTLSIAHLLNQQAGVQVSHEEPPLLPWKPRSSNVIRERFRRFRRQRDGEILGDVASFYLPYVEDAIAAEPDIRIFCLRRARAEVVDSFCQWIDKVHPLPTNHWSDEPAPGCYHEPNYSRMFPKYDIQDRGEAIGRYWDEYCERVDDLIGRYPDQVRLFDMQDVLGTEEGQRDLLTFLGIPRERQEIVLGVQINRVPQRPPRPQAPPASSHPLDPRRCAVLVPFSGHVHPQCERALKELERRGYAVRRVGGYAAIDQGRNQMVTDALLDGFEETMWIDADIEFHPDSVDHLRSHALPIICGIYPQKGKRALACHIMPGTPNLVFGKGGGLSELLYAGTGFLLVRREVYQSIQDRLDLPMCNERFGSPMIPFFHPMVHEYEDGHWYLAEDFAFCQRARSCGYKIMADTTIRLWHIGSCGYSWEDAGMDRPRNESFTLNFDPPDRHKPHTPLQQTPGEPARQPSN